jgi:parallel beta-helix repeat protein
VENNTCNSNDIGIILESALSYTSSSDQANWEENWEESHANTVVNNICNNNRIGIYLGYGCVYSTWVVDNTYLDNNEYDLYKEIGAGEDGPENPQLIGFVGWIGFITVTLLGGGWIVGKRLSTGE